MTVILHGYVESTFFDVCFDRCTNVTCKSLWIDDNTVNLHFDCKTDDYDSKEMEEWVKAFIEMKTENVTIQDIKTKTECDLIREQNFEQKPSRFLQTQAEARVEFDLRKVSLWDIFFLLQQEQLFCEIYGKTY